VRTLQATGHYASSFFIWLRNEGGDSDYLRWCSDGSNEDYERRENGFFLPLENEWHHWRFAAIDGHDAIDGR
jgi:hypothetical protein